VRREQAKETQWRIQGTIARRRCVVRRRSTHHFVIRRPRWPRIPVQYYVLPLLLLLCSRMSLLSSSVLGRTAEGQIGNVAI
jgi:hypothetical protein